MIGDWLIDSTDLGVALVMCPNLTFDFSLCSLTTRQTAAVNVVLTEETVAPLVILPPPQFTSLPLLADLTDMKQSLCPLMVMTYESFLLTRWRFGQMLEYPPLQVERFIVACSLCSSNFIQLIQYCIKKSTGMPKNNGLCNCFLLLSTDVFTSDFSKQRF